MGQQHHQAHQHTHNHKGNCCHHEQKAQSPHAVLEKNGWISLTVIMIAFPVLFFLCVYFPIWMGWTETW